MAFGPSVWIQIHINIGFTKFGATAFIISFLRLRCGAHLIHQPTADNLVEPTERVLLLSCLHYSNSPFAVQYYRPMLRNVRQSWILHPIPWIVDSKCWIPVFFSGTWILDSIPQWDFGVLELYSGFQSPVFRIPRAKFSRILDSTSKNFPDSRIRIPLHGAKYQSNIFGTCHLLTFNFKMWWIGVTPGQCSFLRLDHIFNQKRSGSETIFSRLHIIDLTRMFGAVGN